MKKFTSLLLIVVLLIGMVSIAQAQENSYIHSEEETGIVFTATEEQLEIINSIYGTEMSSLEYLTTVYPEQLHRIPANLLDSLANMDYVWEDSSSGSSNKSTRELVGITFKDCSASMGYRNAGTTARYLFGTGYTKIGVTASSFSASDCVIAQSLDIFFGNSVVKSKYTVSTADKTISTTQQVLKPFLGTYTTKVRHTFVYPPDAEIIDKTHYRDSEVTCDIEYY